MRLPPNRLRLEQLENRQMLAVFTVTNLNDGPVAAPGDLPGSLRQAIYDANRTAGADDIEWGAGLKGTVTLTGGQLAVTEAMTISGLGADQTTIHAAGESRVFLFDDGSTDLIDVVVDGLQLAGGFATRGGGVLNYENLTIMNTVITGNTTADGDASSNGGHGGGLYSRYGALVISNSVFSHNSTGTGFDGGAGGGIYARESSLTISNSVISDNATGDSNSMGPFENSAGGIRGGHGGGIFFQYGVLTIRDSTVIRNSTGSGYRGGSGGGIWTAARMVSISGSEISNNSTGTGYNDAGFGGGLYAGRGREPFGSMTISDSTISGNSAATSTGPFSPGRAGYGGGIFGRGFMPVTVEDSTISGNSSAGSGGGVFLYDRLTVSGSTISGNRTRDAGGGIFSSDVLTIAHSTITDNSAVRGGGIHHTADPIYIDHSVVAGNEAAVLGPDLRSFLVTPTVKHSLIGNNAESGLLEAPVGTPDPSGNLIGGLKHGSINPRLGPLNNNGGPTLTRALLPTSPAIDAGDPIAMAGVGNVPLFDQRGMGFGRVANGRVDIGAFEVQPPPVSCDFDGDGACDLEDIDALVAVIASGSHNPQYDLTGDALVDPADRDAWLVEAGAMNLPSGNPFILGDANLDGRVDGQDFIAWNQHKWTFTGAWSQGDFNADGQTDGQDFVIWNQFKFQESDEEDGQPFRQPGDQPFHVWEVL